ncbi:hypothetical protein [Natronosalvus rutilus]|uniref:Uncharacterized protein n=1 Tax=Natronosalvus rutilus TaxID=2953753 RepID=A0A9E7NDB8_9EURY|nr:hypothetical protein [Natronosalvus rutilus]UTF54798.1 hypothetical protein NGM29_05900 [Natronosalvus rutilus]
MYTPHLQYWVAITITLTIIALLVMFFGDVQGKYSGLLGILAIIYITGFPLLRGYYFYALSDGFGHLGYVRDVGTYSIIQRTNLYPGMHLEAGIIGLITSHSPETSIMLMIPMAVLLFTLSVGVAVRRLTNHQTSTSVGVLMSLFIAPNMSAQNPLLEPTPSSVAIFFSAFPILVLLFLIDQRKWQYTTILLISFVSLLLFHPQYAVAFILFTATVSFLIYLLPTRIPGRISRDTGILSIILGILIYGWIIDKTGMRGALVYLMRSVLEIGETSSAGIQTRGEGLAAVGTSIIEIALKILSPKIFLCILAVATIIRIEAVRRSRLRRWYLSHASVYFISCSTVALFIIVYSSIGQLIQAVRYSAFLLVFITIFAALGVGISQKNRLGSLKIGLTIILIICLVVTVPVYFLSPYIYQGSPNTPESEFTGYDITFTYQGEAGVATTRGEPDRFWTGLYGDYENRVQGPRSDNKVLADIDSNRAESYYVPYHWNSSTPSGAISKEIYVISSERAKEIDVELYSGLRFTKDELRLLETDTRSKKIVDTKGNTVYLVHPME